MLVIYIIHYRTYAADVREGKEEYTTSAQHRSESPRQSKTLYKSGETSSTEGDDDYYSYNYKAGFI